MRVSFSISLFAHLAVLAWASFAFPTTRPYQVEPMKALPVDIVSVSELTRLKAGVKKPEPEPDKQASPKKPEVEKPVAENNEKAENPKQVAALPPPPPPEPEQPKVATPAPVTPRPQPRVEEPKKNPEPEPAPTPEPEPKKAEEKPKPEPEKTEVKEAEKEPPPMPTVRPAHVPRPAPAAPKRKERDFDADKIAALLNKIPSQSGAPASGQPTVSEPPAAGDPRGLDSRMSISELDALRSQISPCWSPPIGVQGAADLAVQLQLALNVDGTLLRPPDILTRGSGLAFLAAADAARRAVLRCQPYELPPGKYDVWRDIKVNFDPRDMLGG